MLKCCRTISSFTSCKGKATETDVGSDGVAKAPTRCIQYLLHLFVARAPRSPTAPSAPKPACLGHMTAEQAWPSALGTAQAGEVEAIEGGAHPARLIGRQALQILVQLLQSLQERRGGGRGPKETGGAGARADRPWATERSAGARKSLTAVHIVLGGEEGHRAELPAGALASSPALTSGSDGPSPPLLLLLLERRASLSCVMAARKGKFSSAAPWTPAGRMRQVFEQRTKACVLSVRKKLPPKSRFLGMAQHPQRTVAGNRLGAAQ